MEFKKFLQGVGFGTIILLTFLACNALYEYFVPLSQITEDEDKGDRTAADYADAEPEITE